MKRDYSNLPEHLPVGKLAFNDSTNELFIGAGDDSPPQKVTDMDIQDELNQASIDYSGEHHENLKDSMDANVDFIMGEFNSTQMTGEFITAQNTLPRHIKRAELRGHTEVNLIQEPSGQDLVLPYEFEDTQSLTLEDTKESGAVNIVLKGNTEVNVLKNPMRDYVVPYEFEEGTNITINDTKETGSLQSAILKGQTLVNLIKDNTEDEVLLTEGHKDLKLLYTLKNSTQYTLLMNVVSVDDNNTPNWWCGIMKTGDWGSESKRYVKGINKLLFTTKEESDCYAVRIRGLGTTIKEIMLLEGDYTNVDIPYFTGMQSVKMPVLTTTGKNLLNPNTLELVTKSINHAQTFTYDAITDTFEFLSPSSYNQMIIGIKNSYGITSSEQVYIVGTCETNDNVVHNVSRRIIVDENTIEIGFIVDWKPVVKANIKIMLTKDINATATTYEPYKSNILSCLEPVELCCVGEVRDELDLITGEMTRRIAHYKFDGSENWIKRNDGDGVNTISFHIDLENTNANTVNFINNIFNFSGSSTSGIEGCAFSGTMLMVQINRSRLDTVDLEGFKKWLQTSNFSLQVPLATESIKTVDLTVQDQDGLSVPALSTYNEVTHISTSSQEGSLLPSVSSKIPEFPVMIKPSTKYSIVADTSENGHTNVPLTYHLGGAEVETEVGNKVTVITTPSTLTNETFKVTGTGMKLSNVMILEKDLTGKEIPNYTEGMQSVRMPVLTTTGKNLYNFTLSDFDTRKGVIIHYNNSSITFTGIYTSDNLWVTAHMEKPIKLKKGTYHYSCTGQELETIYFTTEDGIKRYIGQWVVENDTEINKIHIGFRQNKNYNDVRFNIQIEEGTQATSYEPYKSNILSCNEEVTLRGIGDVKDTVNCLTGEVVENTIKLTFSGIENWGTSTNLTNYMTFRLAKPSNMITADSHSSASKYVCDKLQIVSSNTVGSTEIEAIWFSSGHIYIRLPKTKASSLEEFKTYLSTNNIQVVSCAKQPVVKTVDLNIINQNGQKVDKLSTFNGVTYVESSVAENSLKPIISHKDLEYEVLLKPNTKYSIITNPISNKHTNSPISFDLGGQQVETTVGSYCTLVTTPSTLTHDKLVMKGKGNKLSGGVMIFEGDKTGMMFNHFDGMKSVENPVFKTVGKNLFDSEHFCSYLGLTPLKGGFLCNTHTKKYPFKTFGRTCMTVKHKGLEGATSGKSIIQVNYADGTVGHTSLNNLKYVWEKPIDSIQVNSWQGGPTEVTEIMWYYVENNETTYLSYEPYESNTLSLTIPMRSLPNRVCDTLDLITGEYTQKIGEFIFTGDLDYGTKHIGEQEGYYSLSLPYYIIPGMYAHIEHNNEAFYCDYPLSITRKINKEWICSFYINGTVAGRYICINIKADSKETALQYLRENPITLQYPLETPITTKLDLAWEDGKLFAYDGTTHFFVDVDGGHLQPVLDIDVPVNIVAELSRLRAEKEQLHLEKGQLESQLSLVSYHNEDLSSNVQSLLAENSQLKLQAQDLQTRSNVLQLKNKELQQHQEKLQAENVELQERASQLTQATENLTEGLHTVDAVRESGDLELLSSDFDLDFRLMEIEFALDIATPMSLFKGVKTMARTPYEMAKTLILGGKYDRADMEYKLGRYLERKQLTQEQYDELMALIEATDLVG